MLFCLLSIASNVSQSSECLWKTFLLSLYVIWHQQHNWLKNLTQFILQSSLTFELDIQFLFPKRQPWESLLFILLFNGSKLFSLVSTKMYLPNQKWMNFYNFWVLKNSWGTISLFHFSGRTAGSNKVGKLSRLKY